MIALARQILVLFKLRIGVAMVLTATASLAVTPGPSPTGMQTFILALAVLLSAGAAGGFNHYFDYDIDARMSRTRNRPFVTGALQRSQKWLWILALLLTFSVAITAYAIHAIAAFHVFMGAFFYGIVYTAWLKRRTWLNIVIGGLAGSFAVLAGATTVTPHLTTVPYALALVLFLWTPSHFWSLAIALQEDYRQAGVPMLPVVAGNSVTAKAILFNTSLLVMASLIPFWYGMGWLYLFGAVAGGGLFLGRSLQLLWNPCRERAMSNFYASLIHLALLLSFAVLDKQDWAPLFSL
ncbi:MAG: protoheme IX farnesyltransferase [Magnetococcales bacterium]|nr:protoheme IX farnesyltransferase [Magnetococcales bacterium]NGZ26037.1 protoheme IX farnesyltransferase [Magnetococcales bacterium]